MKSWLLRYFESFSFIGLVFSILFFSASVTPSLLPRNFLFQGLLSGFALAAGYGVGVGFLNLYLFLELPKPSDKLGAYFQDGYIGCGCRRICCLFEADDVLAKLHSRINGNASLGNRSPLHDCSYCRVPLLVV